jgi:hypothetical protein
MVGGVSSSLKRLATVPASEWLAGVFRTGEVLVALAREA